MFTALIYTDVIATVVQTFSFTFWIFNWIGNRQLNRQMNQQLVGSCPSKPQNSNIGLWSFSRASLLCLQPSFIFMFNYLSFRQSFYITVWIGNWIGNRQLNRQLVGNCHSNPQNSNIGLWTFSKASLLCPQPSFILMFKYLSFRQRFYITVRIGDWIGNRQLNLIHILNLQLNRHLNRQPAIESGIESAAESATGNWIGIWISIWNGNLIGNRQLNRQPATRF